MQLTTEETNRYHQLKAKCKSAWIDFATAILEIRERKLYLIEHSTFEAFCTNELSINKSYAYYLLSSAEVLKNLSVHQSGHLPKTERHARPLAKLQPELQREVWEEVIEENNYQDISSKIVAEKVETKKELNEIVKDVKRENQPDTIFAQTPLTEKEILKRAKEIKAAQKPHVSYNSENNEWYTPPLYVEAARKIMGSIDLDPASSEIANKVVKAKKYYTKEDNGLNKKWHGNVWLNPPYQKDLIKEFINKIATEKEVKNICILVNNATETKWGQSLINIANCVCFIKSRIKFLDYTGKVANSPLQGQMVIYIGDSQNKFYTEFSKLGICLTR